MTGRTKARAGGIRRRAATRRGRAAQPLRGRAAKARRPKPARTIFAFGGGRADGNARMKDLLGGKGANLAEMAGLGVPVPPGFTISTEVCRYYPPGLEREVAAKLAWVETVIGRRFGDPADPLLVSVRSGAPASMPGMMDTILNLGLNDQTVQGLIAQSGDPRFAYDCYRRFVQMYGDVVLGLKPEAKTDPDPFEAILERKKEQRGVRLDVELSADDLRDLVTEFKTVVKARRGVDFPAEPLAQLWGAIGAVFRSWNNARAVVYRKLNDIPDDWGTAVNIQVMVFGNLGNDCATGVAFTRDPATGEKRFYGEFLPNAQGEDVVAGIRTPRQITKSASQRWAAGQGVAERERVERYPSLEEAMPRCYRELEKIGRKLERHYRDTQDLEFTIERNHLWMLQTRTGKRTAAAAVKIAVDMVRERLIDRKTAVLRVQPDVLDQLLHPQLDPRATRDPLAKGLPASPGAAAGTVVFAADDAERAAQGGAKVILVRVETSPEDIQGMHAAQGILTARGGMTSHAAVVARGMGKCCVAGCGDLAIDYEHEQFSVNGRVVRRGDPITLDGSTGEVFAGRVPTVAPTLSGDFATFMGWADQFRRLGVRANADTATDAEVARRFGAEGIGLCRTEHMFFEADRIAAVREMILSSDREGRERALAKILPMQKGDFKALFRVMAGLPVTIRLLDPPLHEFLPHTDEELRGLAPTMGVDVDTLRRKRDALREFNPMLGHRGCRLGITFPEIYIMQVRAIAEAACELRRGKVEALPEIMIPLVGDVRELRILRDDAQRVIDEVTSRTGVRAEFPIGTMIELPRAAVTADEIAGQADFFSFGTNDLTQMVFGLSRDDAGKFVPEYTRRGIFPTDPFVSLDRRGVGLLVRMGVEKGRRAQPRLKVGICGEHGGDPRSILFCHQAGLDYVSCSPYRVPIARLAAAHAALLAAAGQRAAV
ncbi:MAG: pyruvate, phosphate dikinase [Candidatus Binatia bacterium]